MEQYEAVVGEELRVAIRGEPKIGRLLAGSGRPKNAMSYCQTIGRKVPAGLPWYLLAGFDGHVVAYCRCAVSEPAWNVGFPPVDRTGGESLLHSREVEVPGVGEELVCFVPFFAPLPAGMFDADLG